MKNYQTVIGGLFIAAAIVIAGILIADSIQAGFESLRSAVSYSAERLR